MRPYKWYKTLDSIATPASVKAIGIFRLPRHLDVPIWNIKFLNSTESLKIVVYSVQTTKGRRQKAEGKN